MQLGKREGLSEKTRNLGSGDAFLRSPILPFVPKAAILKRNPVTLLFFFSLTWGFKASILKPLKWDLYCLLKP